uniref:Uncharacterized protein n=1 Tax=Trichobilharzia regenti TaxID=157069 RepID=A0AA85IQ92_TRIRE|nr:unnamed protein product [Trichobilharzia regenti]
MNTYFYLFKTNYNMRHFLLFITSFILLHVQQSTQDNLHMIKSKISWIEDRLRWNEVSFRKNNATLAIVEKALHKQIEKVNTKLSLVGLSVDKHVFCKRKEMEGKTGVTLMQNLVKVIQVEEDLGYTNSYIAKMKQCFQNKTNKYKELVRIYGTGICLFSHPLKEFHEIYPIEDMNVQLYREIGAQAEIVFEKKLFTALLNDQKKLIPAE